LGNDRRRATDDGRRQVAGGSGQCSVDSGQWTVDSDARGVRHSSFVICRLAHWLIG